MNPLQRRLQAARSALVLVDYQQRLMPAIYDGERVVAQALRLAQLAQLVQVPVFGTEQNPPGLGPNVEPLRDACLQTLAKTHFDACEDGLLELLSDVDDVVIAGCEAHVCLLQTVLGLRRAGRQVAVVAAACGSRSAQDRELALQRLHAAGALIVSTEMIAFEWLQDCQHARFKDVLALVKTAP